MIDAKDNFLKAVAAFERTFKCFIAVHDYAGLIRESLPELPVYHLNPYCTIIKSRKSEHLSCIAFDSKYVQERLSQNNEPFWKLCQHGLFEAVIPVVNEGRTLGVVFAGPFRGNSKNFIDVLLTGRKPDELPEKWSKKIPEVAPSANSPVIALGGLLASGIIGVIAETRKRKMSGGISRKEVIGDFFERNHSRQIMLSDLAGHLNLCDSRTSQLLKQYFNKGFAELLNEYRINHAKSLLRNSMFKVGQVAAYCGFSDASYFHRVFHQATGIAPGEFRKLHGVQSEAP